MLERWTVAGRWVATLVILVSGGLAAPVEAQVLFEDFDAVTGSGGGVFLEGTGTGTWIDWDTGIFGETAFGGTWGNARVEMSAAGNPTGGMGGTGAGELHVTLRSYNIIEEDFSSVTGTGGGVFPVGTNGMGMVTSWDDGLNNEWAFFEAHDGAMPGTPSAYGDPGGGEDAGGAGVLDVSDVTLNGGTWAAGLVWDAPGLPGLLRNPGFDDNTWWPPPDYWDYWGWCGYYYCTVIMLNPSNYGWALPAVSEPNILKMWDDSGVLQELSAQEGQTWELSCYSWNRDGDSLNGGRVGIMEIEFYDALNTLLDSTSAVILDRFSPLDVWIYNPPIQLTAPPGTAKARAVIRTTTDGSGAAHFDSVSFRIVSGPGQFDLGSFGLYADIKGDVNASGETYGHYQLRLEDEERDRLVFQSQTAADGTWATLGGPLDQAVEQDSSGTAATGVFNPGAGVLRVVVAFDNDAAPGWGTGGTLSVDNLLLMNSNGEGSEWHAGMFWDDLPVSPVTSQERLMLTADVKISEVGGKYELRLEGYEHVLCVDEDFEGATGAGGDKLVRAGQTGGTSYDWDTGLQNEYGFAGLVGAVATTGGAWIRAVTSGGYGDDGSAGEIQVHEVALAPDEIWYAGAAWRNQSLPTTDLTQISLTANIKGTWNATWLEAASPYVLRIEDGGGDWIGFTGMSNGSWQSMGGVLSSAPASGIGDYGDGVFDIDTNGTYSVVVVMESAADTDWGGTLLVDNVLLTPCGDPVAIEAGRVTFTGLGDGSYQQVGGLLTEGTSTWIPEGGQFYPDYGDVIDSWDAGIAGDWCFAGLWDSTLDTVSAEGCSACGLGGGGGGRLSFTGGGSTGVYWLGVCWPNLPVDLSGGVSSLSQISITADVKGTWDAGAGETPGLVTLRLEDTTENRYAFDLTVDGIWQAIGGTLDTAIAPAEFEFDLYSYTLTIIVYGPRTPDWNGGGTITFDNVTLVDHGVTIFSESFETVVGPGPRELTGLDSYTVALVAEDGVSTWGGSGTLSADNLLLTPTAASCDEDSDIDLADLAIFQICFTGEEGGPASSGCECTDVDLDGDVDLADYAVFSVLMDGPL